MGLRVLEDRYGRPTLILIHPMVTTQRIELHCTRNRYLISRATMVLNFNASTVQYVRLPSLSDEETRTRQLRRFSLFALTDVNVRAIDEFHLSCRRRAFVIPSLTMHRHL